ncbi:hypothetical protein [Tenacibaculum sp. M341]|uniref:hypothetical protein n=1 Tax=Tenacibaculum sp. M341 TaxID=2530339 RepID=UPI001044E766|nr:hypothetical protein [Tenacibaculum sp. M341]TCI90188.1 hypothetical protein EYW44_14745 [Tenacibaculum sp. M341]
MKKIYLLLFIVFSVKIFSQTKTIHVYVALCDNKYQGIVPVPKTLGNGKDPRNNLYWGAAYGVKSYLKYKTKDWSLVANLKPDNVNVLERVLFKHKSKDMYLLADAYDGEQIKNCTIDFLKASNNQRKEEIVYKDKRLNFGGSSNLVSYIGHDGLMDFNVSIPYNNSTSNKKDVIILACYSQHFFSKELRKANANPILLTTNLMAPEAYTLKAALDGWSLLESKKEIKERAAKAYHKYQKCGLRGARNLFNTSLK